MCFGIGFIEQLLIWLVIVCVVVAIVRLLLPFILSQLGVAGGVVMQVINILIWAFVVLFVIYVCFDLISCLGGFPRLSRF